MFGDHSLQPIVRRSQTCPNYSHNDCQWSISVGAMSENGWVLDAISQPQHDHDHNQFFNTKKELCLISN